MKQYFNYSFLIALFVLSACEPEIDNKPIFGAGEELDVTTYVAIGDAWTAGVNNNGLTLESQQFSYPNLLAQQLQMIGGGNFIQPLLPDGNGSGQYVLVGIDNDICEGTSPLPDVERIEATDDWNANVTNSGPFNNIGVQRISLKSVNDDEWSTTTFQNIDSLNNNGPHLQRLVNLSVVDTTSYLDLVEHTFQEKQPTFFTSWLGFTDALIYAASGGGYITGKLPFLGNVYVCDFDPIAISDASRLTDTNVFEENYRAVLDKVFATTNEVPKGVLITLPKVTDLPYFSAVNNALDEIEVNQSTCEDTVLLNVRRVPNCEEQLPVFGISGANNEDTIRATDCDYPLLTARFSFGLAPAFECETNNTPHGFTTQNPLLNSEFLDNSEELKVRAKINSYNKVIEQLGEDYNLPVLDMTSFFSSLNTNGKVYNGVDVNGEFLTGNFFGLDGLHFTPMGNAIVTNEIINLLNLTYNANIPQLIVTDYPSVSFP